jgi:hypothetical protein
MLEHCARKRMKRAKDECGGRVEEEALRSCRGSGLDRAKAVQLDVTVIWKGKASAMIAKRKAAEFLNVPSTAP